MTLPEKGIPREELLARMRERKRADADWRGGRTFSLVYPAGEDVDAILRDAAELYLFENALNPFRFPSLRQMEDEVVALAAGLLHGGPEAGGAMTSGGTESILMAVKTARARPDGARGDQARAGGALLRASGLREGGPLPRARAQADPAGTRLPRGRRRRREADRRRHRARGGLCAKLSVRRDRPDPGAGRS